MRKRAAIVGGVLALSVLAATVPVRAQGFVQGLFEQYLESLMRQAGIPGLSAAIVHDGRMAWERGFGDRDLGRRLPALADTPYAVAGLTETLTSTLLLQCVERGTLDLDEPADAGGATVRQLLSHTSTGTFRYDPQRFQALTAVVERCTKSPFRVAVAHEILDRLGMRDSVPGQDFAAPDRTLALLFPPPVLARYREVMDRLASPYRVGGQGDASPSTLPRVGMDASTGLVSTVRDLARFDAALDEGVLIRPATREMAFTPTGSPHMGLGWFVQTYKGHRVVWHFGVWPGAGSSLIVKVPDRRLTLILLANSDGLAASFPLTSGDVTTSLFARLFLSVYL